MYFLEIPAAQGAQAWLSWAPASGSHASAIQVSPGLHSFLEPGVSSQAQAVLGRVSSLAPMDWVPCFLWVSAGACLSSQTPSGQLLSAPCHDVAPYFFTVGRRISGFTQAGLRLPSGHTAEHNQR